MNLGIDVLCFFYFFFMDCDIFVWNCQGANDNNFSRTIHYFIRQYKPKILMLFELRISGIKVDRVIKGLRYDRSH